MKTEAEILAAVERGALKFHHTAYFRGYESRTRKEKRVALYKGRFGCGYQVFSPNRESTQYSLVSYYVEAQP